MTLKDNSNWKKKLRKCLQRYFWQIAFFNLSFYRNILELFTELLKFYLDVNDDNIPEENFIKENSKVKFNKILIKPVS